MATGAEAIQAIGAVVSPGISPGTVASVARALREAGEDLWPMGGRGGGKNAAHVTNHHLKNLLLGLTALTPGEAPMAAAALSELRFDKIRSLTSDKRNLVTDASNRVAKRLIGWDEDMTQRETGTFGQWIENFIADNKDDLSRKALAIHYNGVEISMCVAPAVAMITSYSVDGEHSNIFLRREEIAADPNYQDSRVIRRPRKTTILTYDVITVAGALWGDTLARRAVMTTQSLLAKAVPNASPRTENARAAIPIATRASLGFPLEGYAQAGS
jgi:hypothetical protein